MGEKLTNFSKKIGRSIKNPSYKKKWRGLVGVAFIVFFVMFTVVFEGSHIAQALKNTGYGYGYGYGTATTAGYYAYGYRMSDDYPTTVGALGVTTTSTTAAFSWTYPTTTVQGTSLDNPSGVCLKYSASSVLSCTKGTTTTCAIDTNCYAGYATTTKSLSSLTAGTTYYYVLQAYDDNYVYGTASTGSFTTPSTTTSDPGGGGGGTPTGEPPVITPPEDTDPTVETAVPSLPAVRDLALEKSAIIEMRDNLGIVPGTDSEWKMVQYIAYGAGPGSAKLSVRDRRGVLGDYYDTYGDYPTVDAHWIDIELILTSHKPHRRNLDQERYGIDEFVRIYKRLPDWANVYDDWAVSYISYKIRNVGRNLDSERAGIASFRSVYKRIPVSSQDWATTRAITYSGASR